PAADAAGGLAERRPAPGRAIGAQGIPAVPAAGHARASHDLRRRRRKLRVQAPERAARRALEGRRRRRHRDARQEPFLGARRPGRSLERAVRRCTSPHAARPVKEYLEPARYIDSAHPAVVAFSRKHASGKSSLERAVSLYYEVRDGVRYNPFLDFSKEETFRASHCIATGEGFCVGKAAL